MGQRQSPWRWSRPPVKVVLGAVLAILIAQFLVLGIVQANRDR